MTKLPQIAPFHAPALVRLITAELAEDDLAYGVEVELCMRRRSPAVPPSVRPRYGGPLGDTHLRNVDGVMLYGDDFAMPGDAVLVRLQTRAVDARSALRFALLDCPGLTKSAAFERVRQLCPRQACAPLKGIGVARGLTLG